MHHWSTTKMGYNEDGVLLLGRGALASRPPQTIPREELNALVLGIKAVDELLHSVTTFEYSPKQIIVLYDSLLNIQRLRKSRYYELQTIYEANRAQQIVTTCQSWGISCTFYHIDPEDAKGFRTIKDLNYLEIVICSVELLSDSSTKSVIDIKRKVLQYLVDLFFGKLG